jgi:hypothetical protein
MKPSFVLRFGMTGLALWLTACATDPVTGNPNFVVMSESQEISMGRGADAFALSGGCIQDVNYAKLARTSSLGKNSEGYLRLLNAQYPSGEPARGQALKIVE